MRPPLFIIIGNLPTLLQLLPNSQ